MNNDSTKKFVKTFFSSLWTVIKSFALVGLLAGIAAMMLGSFILVKTIETAPELDVSKIYATESSYIYDKDGEIITELGIEKRDWVSYEDISPVVIDAFLATEDSRFFEHHGVDWYRFIAAFITNIFSGDFDQGASTISQQLIKQSHLSPDKTITRKLQEIYLSMELEKVLTKEQIMEAYLNFSPFGGSVYGIQKAAEYYFGKDADEIVLSEAAVLAGLVQSPNKHRPDRFPDQAETRRDTVLKLMVLHGYIDQTEADLAAAQPVTDMLAYEEPEVDDLQIYQSFIDVVLKEVEEKYGLNAYSGLQIYTTMDKDAQETLFDIQNGDAPVNLNGLESGIVFMDTKTGKVLGIGGGAAKEGERMFNNATDVERQPGSTAKPIFAYGPAIEYLGWGTGTTVEDKLYTYKSSPSTVVHNWDLMYRGPVTVRHALNQSLNVPAVTAFNAVGADKVGKFAKSLGIPVTEGEVYESLAIGGTTTGYSPMEMAAAYAAFGNGGVYNEPITVEKIVKSDGSVILADQESERVMSEQTAYLMTNMLRSIMTEGTGTKANVPGIYLAGKTGTTNFDDATTAALGLPRNAIRDSWFVGYSENFTTSIWTGHVKTENSSQYITNTTQATPWYMFKYINSQLNTDDATAPTRPSGIVSASIEEETYPVKRPSALTPGAYISNELFISGNQPSQYSTRFEKLDTPQNVKGSYNGKELTLTWDHVENHTLPVNEIDSMLSVHRANQSRSLGNFASVSVAEDVLRMMKNQINIIGATSYTVYAKDFKGDEVELGKVQDNEFKLPLTIAEMSYYKEFYVQASYEKHDGMASDKSKGVNVACDNCFEPIRLPNMSGWTKADVEKFATENNLKLTINEVETNQYPVGTVIQTSPKADEIMEPEQTLTVDIASEQLVVPDYRANADFAANYQAWAALHNITVTTVEANSDTVPAGGLISTNPGIGSSIQKGSALTLTISTGPATPPPTPDPDPDPDPEPTPDPDPNPTPGV